MPALCLSAVAPRRHPEPIRVPARVTGRHQLWDERNVGNGQADAGAAWLSSVAYWRGRVELPLQAHYLVLDRRRGGELAARHGRERYGHHAGCACQFHAREPVAPRSASSDLPITRHHLVEGLNVKVEVTTRDASPNVNCTPE